jgi:hypothetical protein
MTDTIQICFNIILPPTRRSPKLFLPFTFFDYSFICVSFLTCVLHTKTILRDLINLIIIDEQLASFSYLLSVYTIDLLEMTVARLVKTCGFS